MPSELDALNNMFLHLGQFLLNIVWKGNVSGFPSFEWQEKKDIQIVPEYTWVIYLEVKKIPSIENASDGWRELYWDNSRQAIYFYEGKPIFSLKYVPTENNISVFMCRPTEKNIKLGIQFGMLLALHRYCVGLHGVTLLCGDEIIILSAPSGTGKTTLAHLLEIYFDAIVINGDFALLSWSEEGVIFEPTPFCGTSGRCLNYRLRVNRVVFLEQAKDNQWSDLGGREAMIRFMDNAFIPTWQAGIRQLVQHNIAGCLSLIKANSFSFAPTREAAEMFFDQLRISGEQSS